ncbi:hypothetical protein HHK36_015282 [Tetracentron sinense]|uniref:Polygalacturonase n=1 Tax=Tetracentron sinense TaxID=13715 RepID=A0A834Z4U2_TETSI|nr:hypothetical protein HHK36_015282 [Tetracentron sinense]
MELSLFLFVLLSLTAPLLVQSHHQEPNNGAHVFNVFHYGAVGDGRADDTQAFTDAWKATCMSSSSSPTMHIPWEKTFLLQPLIFRGPCQSKNVHVEINGKIVAPSDPSKWKCNHSYCNKWIKFVRVDGLSISGSGTIDGQGSRWWDLSCGHNEHVRLVTLYKLQSFPIGNETVYLSIANCMHFGIFLFFQGCLVAPTGFVIAHSNNVHLSGLIFMDSPNMHIFFERSTGIYASNLSITAPGNSPNTDGIHIQKCTNVFIDHSQIGTGDDCISISDGSSHINISRIVCGPGHGISIGSLGKGGNEETVEYVHVSDVEFRGTSNGVRIKTWQKSAVRISNVTYSEIYGTSNRNTAVWFACSESVPCTDIFVKNINIQSTENGEETWSYCQNAYGRVHGEVVPMVPCLDRR